MNSKKLLFILPLLFLTLCAEAQNELKTVKSAIKAGSKLDEAEKTINAALEKEEHRSDPEYYLAAFEVQKKINATENEKAFLKQKYDTARLFTSIQKMYNYLIRLDSIDAQPDAKGRVHPKYRKKSARELMPYRENLLAAGKYYYRKADYNNSYDYLTLYMNCYRQPLFESEVSVIDTTGYSRISYYASTCAHRLGNASKLFTVAPSALCDTTYAPTVQEYIAESYHESGDTTQWVETLKDGVFRYPASAYFFAHLVDYYSATGRYTEALDFSSSMLEMDSTAFHLYAKGLILYYMQQYDECKQLCTQALQRDSLYADAYFTLGSCWCNQADELRRTLTGKSSARQLREDRARMKDYYEQARAYLEKYRALRPDEKKWAPVLYDIYLNLNMGKEFEEIDAIVNSK
jgi:tetratricopeptide (TPR) repeat protein